MSSGRSNAPKQKRWTHRKGFVSYFIAALVFFLMSSIENKSPTPEGSEQEGFLGLPSADWWYQHTLGEPQDPARHVAVIILGVWKIGSGIDQAGQQQGRERDGIGAPDSTCKR